MCTFGSYDRATGIYTEGYMLNGKMCFRRKGRYKTDGSLKHG